MTPKTGRVVAVVVDDDPVLASIVANILADDYEVLTITSQFARALDPDTWEGAQLAIVDLRLSVDLDGESILAYLRDSHPDIRRIAITASGTPPKEVYRLAHTVLQKPFAPGELLDSIRTAGEQEGPGASD